MPLVPQSQADRIKRLEERNTYANYVIDEQAAREKRILRANIIGGSDANLEESAHIPIVRGPTYFKQDELTNILFENSIQTIPSGLFIDEVIPGNGIAKIQFRLISNGASYIKDYLYSLDGEPYISVGYLVNPIIISGLQNGVTYSITIKALNSIGYSEPSNAATVTPATLPSVPSISGVPGNTLAIITYDSNVFNGGAPILEYTYSLDTRVYRPFKTLTNPLVVDNLINGSNYVIRIKSRNYIGSSDPSNSVSIMPASVPLSPTITSIDYGNRSASVNYIAGFDGYSEILDYEYSIDTGISYISIGSTSNPLLISDLINGVTYNISIRARNFIGYSPASAILPVKPRTIPSAPTITRIERGNSNGTVFFTQTDNGGEAITEYRYSVGYGYISAGLNSPFIISDLSNGLTYEVTMELVNNVGRSPPSQMVSFVPGSPPYIASTTVTLSNMSALLSFIISNNGGYEITSYYYSVNGTSYTSFTPTNQNNPNNGSYLIPGLTNGTTYPVTMFSSNNIGASPISTSSNVTPGTNPTAPFITSLTLGNLSAVLNFTVSDIGGYAITSYYYNLNGGAYINFGSLDNPYTITGLTNGTTYSVTIKASNAIGISGSSTSSNVKPGIPPSIPITTVVLSNMSALLSFTIANNGGYTITSYYYSIDGSIYTSFTPISPTNNSYLIPDLINGTTYPVTMFSSNDIGASPVSTSSNVTPGTNPTAPFITSLTLANSSAVVNFTVSDIGGYAITSYYYNLNGGAYINFGSLNNPYTITGLTNGTTYSVTIKASNAIGISGSSTSSNVKPGIPPSIPITTVVLSNMSALLSFTIANNGGYTITSYYYSIDGTSYTSFTPISPTNNSYLIPDLINGTTYPVTMFSSNDIGASPVSISSNVTPGTNPTTPFITSLTLGNLSALLNFTVSDIGGYAITSYYYNLNGGAYINFGSLDNPYTITGLTNGITYSVTVKASNAIGISGSSTSSNVKPGIPPSIPITTVVLSNMSALLSFTIANNGGYTITSYYYSIDGTSYTSFTPISPTNNSYLIPDLINGTTYPVTMFSSNDIGASLISSSSNVTPGTNPTAPFITSLTLANSSAVVNFTVSDIGGYAITSYYYNLNGGAYINFGSLDNPYTITGLTNGITYSVTIKASNAIGISGSSTSSNVKPGIPPSIPITTVVLSNMSALLSFTIANNGGYTITSYYYSIDGTSYTSFTPISPTNNSYLIPDLVNGTTYPVTMFSSNDIGASPVSISSNVTPGTNPTAPFITSLTLANSSAVVNFTVSDIGGYAITGYYYNLNGGAYINFGSLDNPYTITGLSNGTTYSVTIKASNAIGISGSSASSNVKPGAPPNPPSFVSLVPGISQASFTFTPGNSNGYAIQSYYYSLGGSYILFSPSGNAFTITGLINSNYTVTLQASNAIGISAASVESNVRPYTLPSAPTFTISRSGSNFNIAYSIEDTGGCNLTTYSYNVNGGSYITSAISGNSFIITSNVSSNVQYAIGMYVTSTAGNSLAISNTFAAVPPTLIATGTSTLYVSLDNISWLRQTSPANINLTSVVWTGSNWIGVGNGTFTSIISSDGISWSNGSNTLPSANTIAWNPVGKYAVAGVRGGNANPDAYISRDGKNWTNPSFPMSNAFGKSDSGNGIAWNGSSWMIVGRSAGGTHIGALSLDGIDWTVVNSFSSNNMSGSEFGTGFGVAWNGTSWSVVGQNTRTNSLPVAFSSNNASNWILSNPFSSTGVLLRGVAWNPRDLYWVVVGYNTGNTISASKSTDGINWTTSSPFPGGQGRSILWTGSNWIATGTTGIAISTDGVNWSTISGISDSINSIVSSNPTLIVGASPSAPTITSIQSGDYQLTVTFTPGASNGYSIQEYYYSIGESYISTSSLANTFTISNLTYGNYAVTLKALSFAGLSLASTPSNGRPFSAPSISIASLSVSDSSAILGFTVDTAGYAVSEYYYNLNGGSYIPFTPSGNSYIIPNLINGSTYSVTLKALNSLGLSSASSASNVKPGAVPIAPSFVSLVEGKNQATLTLTPGNSNGYAIQSYYYSLGGPYILFSPVSNSFTITGLINSNYTVTLKSSNAIGISLASEASNVIPYTNPTAPVISVSRATSNLNVTYSVVSTGGCNLTSYSYSLDGGSYTTSEISGNSFTFSNLIDNIQYIIRMYVTNFAGTSPVSSNVFAAVPPTLIATGTSTLYVSLDSISWLRQPHPTNITLSSVVWTGSNWIGVGSGTFTSIISSNGTIWTNGLNVIPSANAIAWNPLGKYGVAAVRGVSVNADAYITRDGKSWTNPSFPMSNPYAQSQSASGIAWNGSSWMIVGRTFAGTHTAALSLNGINWTPVNSFSSNGMSGSEFGTAFGVAWNGTSWLVVGQNTQNNNLPAGISSNNGTNWVLSHPFSSTGTLLQGVAWNSRDLYWVVVGYNTGNTISAAKSSDGINWTSSTPFPGGQGAAILWTGSIWYATGTTGMATSTDGVNWTTISGITDSITSIVSSNSTLIQ